MRCKKGIQLTITYLFKNFYWSIVDLQCCVNFCCIGKWTSYTFTSIELKCCMAVSLHLSYNLEISNRKFLSLLFPGAECISHCLMMLHNKPHHNLLAWNTKYVFVCSQSCRWTEVWLISARLSTAALLWAAAELGLAPGWN